jgi:D-alanine transaminase
MEALANLNGDIVPLAEARVPALDRGFLLGDAIYEVLRIYRGRPWLEAEHFDRLGRSLDAIRIGGIDLHRLRRRMYQTIAAGPFQEAIAYLQITRGAAPRTHAFPAKAVPLEFLYIQEFQDPYVEARQQGGAAITTPDLRWQRCDIKSTNLLGNVLAMQSAKEADCLEALLYRPDGLLTEGSHTSFFGVLEGAVLTAPATNAILPGITRRLVIGLCSQAAIPVHEQILRLDDLGRVSELFLTGTTTEVLPIVRVDGKPVADGKPGPITRSLQATYDEAVETFLAAT